MNISGVTKHFPTPSETYTNNLSASISAGAVTVPVNANNDYADGDIVVLTVEPGTTNEATFTGEKASTPARFINCVWTEGNLGVGHASGVTITDYDSATHVGMITKGLKVSHNQDGTLKSSAVQTALSLLTTPAVGWNVMAQPFAYTGNNGNGEYTGNFTGDVTTVLDEGMKLQIPRTVTPPTQAMTFNIASSQYASKAAPTGITFTAAFTVEFMIYLNSYQPNDQMVVSRTDTTANNGWYVQIKPDGCPQIAYVSGGSTTAIKSNTAIPVKQWVHVAVVITSTAAKTGGVYINAVNQATNMPAAVATSMTQAGNLTLGRWDSAAQYTDASLGEVRVWSVAQSQAQIAANMNLALVGNESNLVALFQGNGNFNDKTANANNLTASGGASATTLLSSFPNTYVNATEYFYVTKVGAFAAGVTPVTLFGGKDGRLPNQALGTIQYSNVASPYGFPTSRTRWTIESLYFTPGALTGTVSPNWYNISGVGIWLPTGQFKLKPSVNLQSYNSGASTNHHGILAGVSTTAAAEPNLYKPYSRNSLSMGNYYDSVYAAEIPVDNPTFQYYYVNERPLNGVTAGISLNADNGLSSVSAEIAYV